MEWRVREQNQQVAESLAADLSVSPIIAQVLINRGIETPAAGRDFLAPSLEQLRPDQWMADMDRATERIITALEEEQTIGVHGDYDVDGTSATAVLIGFLRALGAAPLSHLPHRQREGYGMKPEGIDKLADQGVKLIISVDCGIGDHQAIERANERGVDVIVSDHHQLPDKLPPAFAVINPQRPECPFRKEDLSGAGIAWYLAAAVRSRLREKGGPLAERAPNLLQFLDLVALGTIADVVPLTGLNRILVRFGLQAVNSGRRPGIKQLMRVAGLRGKEIGTGQVSFQLAPRLNAAGRMSSAETSLELMLTESMEQAAVLAEALEQGNRERREVEAKIITAATEQVLSNPGWRDAPAIVVAGEGWHVGVIGIVASRLIEQFDRPTAVIGISNGVGKGSLRSVSGIDIFTALTGCSSLLEKFGGHPMAAGITINEENIPAFRKALVRVVSDTYSEQGFEKILNVDAELPAHRVERKLVEDLVKLEPHGLGNPRPCFLARNVLVQRSRAARSKTLLLGLEDQGVTIDAVGFRLADRLPQPGSNLDVLYTPVLDTYNGVEKLKLQIKDLRPVHREE